MLNPISSPTRRPVVTIGLPVFNGERYLAGALDSLLAQQGCDFELIIADNASTDRTREICEQYAAKDSRIRYHRNDVNLGAVRNFNLVFDLSDTEYFKWAPYDDLVEPDFVARCIQVLERDPSVVLCYSRAKIIDENGAFVVNYDPGPDTRPEQPHLRFRNLILHPEYAIQQMGVIRSSALRQTPLYGLFPSSDEILLAELSLLGRFHEIPERLYIFRRHQQQSTGTPKQRDRIQFFDPALVGRVVLPTWRYLGSGAQVLRRTPLRFSPLLSCYGTLLRWSLRPDHFRALGKDLLLAAVARSRALRGRQSKVLKQDASLQARVRS
jgi:glycosyltransferase involved in cell wall biosynthesis